MGKLNEGQAKRVLAILRHLDGILEEVKRHARGDSSALQGNRGGLEPEECDALLAAVSRIQGRIASGLAQLGIDVPEQTGSSRRAIETSLSFAHIALAELTRGGLRRYGTLDEGAEAAVADLATELEEMFETAARTLRGRGRTHRQGAVGP